MKGTQRINERELELGLTGSKKSWHDKYKDSAWIFIGGLPYDLQPPELGGAYKRVVSGEPEPFAWFEHVF